MTYKMNCGCGCGGRCGCGTSGFGSYYSLSPHEVYGMGAVSTFNADAVWADAQEGGNASVYQKQKQGCLNEPGADTSLCSKFDSMISNANFRGNRAANAVRDGLRQLGYAPGPNNSMWGGADIAAWKKFCDDEGVPAGPGLVSKSGLDAMEAKLGGGLMKGSMGKLGWLAVGVAAVAVGAALMSGRRKGKSKAPTGKAHIPART